MIETPNTAGRGRRRAPRLLRWAVWGAAGGVLLLGTSALVLSLFFRINAVPEALKPTPASFMAFVHSRDASPSAAQAHGHAPWTESEPPKTFADYARFQLAANPDDQGAALYLELSTRFADDNLNDAWGWAKAFKPSGDASAWKPGDPLTPGQIAWLEAHQNFIDKLHRMIAGGGVPTATEEEVLALDPLKITSAPIPNAAFLRVASLILSAETRRLCDAGDPAAAGERLSDLYSLSKTTGGPFIISSLIGTIVRETAERSAEAWLQNESPSPETARKLVALLDANPFPGGIQIEPMAFESVWSRSALIALMNLPLSESVRALARITGPGISPSDSLFASMVQRPALMLPSLVDAVMMKADGAGFVERYDRFTNRYLEVLNGPYSGIKNFDLESEVKTLSPRSPFGLPKVADWVDRSFAEEARENMIRVSAHLLAGDAAPKDAIPESPAWKKSAWRDPFTEAPLRIEDEGDTILIYSLGPDLKSQGGTIAYDPTNGPASAGDLSIRIAKPKSR